MKFLNSWTLLLDKLPTYSAFKKEFVVELDYALMMKMYNSNYEEYTHNRKLLLKPILDAMKGKNTLKIKHNNRYGLGRFYPDNSISPICISRHMKHTLFQHLGWVDLDMVCGHCTILYEMAKKNSMEHKFVNIKHYLDNRQSIFKELINYYSTEEQSLSDDNVKDIFNIVIYGGGHNTWLKQMEEANIELNTKEPHPFVKSFVSECRNFMEIIYINNPDVVEKVRGNLTEEYQIKSRVMSYWCGTIENHIIHSCYKYLVKRSVIKKNNVVPEYDGLCLELTNNNPEFMDSLLYDINTLIVKETGLNVRMKWKGYNDIHLHLDALEDEETDDDATIVSDFTEATGLESIVDTKEYNETSFEAVRDKFEKNHCKIINKGIFIKTTENGNVVMSKQHLKTAYENMTYVKEKEVNGKVVVEDANFINDWTYNNQKQKCYEDIGVYPPGLDCPPNMFNVWRPFAMELIIDYVEMEKERDEILNHIKILCNHDIEVYNYFIAWIAQMIQYPSVKSVCPILISKEGAGKGALIKLLIKLLGKSKVFETTSPSRDVWGDFNGLMSDAFLVNLNELSKKETLESEGRIKGLITEPTITINNKNVNPYEIKSYHRFIITTNKEEPMNTAKDDRRKLFIRSSDEKIGDKEYFKKIYDYLEDVNIVKTCYEYFKGILHMDKFMTIPLPKTEYHKQLCELSINPIEGWLLHYVSQNQNVPTTELTGGQIYEKFMDWIDESGFEYKCNSTQLAVRLDRLKINGISKKHTKTGNRTIFDITLLKEHFGM